MEQPPVDFLWGECNAGLRRCLGWKSPAVVRAAVEVMRGRHFVEWFCGTGNLCTACSQLGLRVGWPEFADRWDGALRHAGLISHDRCNRLVWRALLDVRLHEPRPYASVTKAATWEHAPP